MLKFLLGLLTGALLLAGVNHFYAWEIRIPKSERNQVPKVKIKAEVKEPKLHELLLLHGKKGD